MDKKIIKIVKRYIEAVPENYKLKRDLRIEPHPFHAKDFQSSAWGNEIIKKGIKIL